ncbi:hypothetical protein Pth03_48000 [Planotetraspora thailandica]|uniref:Glycosyltransferase 2-like domain-containing protein n=1 Tax=Planotetraspora thailandica TaxID=487172 RepID=A0A8J3V402_9ACTN|nr:glycosyltransferase family 2 protein [Planotetraspora thailandica]GII56411.1 hypothetical protein Pth03_48000 [Planotetraspora thailandica]
MTSDPSAAVSLPEPLPELLPGQPADTRVAAPIPRVRGNDYSTLVPPELGTWTPTMRVSVVIPAYGRQEELDLALAGLTQQTYPSGLTEVVVVDNGSEPPLRLPGLRPEGTRLLVCATPGRAAARNTGLRAATGEVVFWLDSDVVAERTALEAHMRWHHQAPYLAVTSRLRFSSAPPPTPADVVETDERSTLFEPSEPHQWLTDLVEHSDGLRAPTQRAFSLHVGGSTSVNAALIAASGPMDEDLTLGQDIELGYRLSQAGAVFVPDREAVGYHLGPTMRMREATAVSRADHAFIPDRIPHYRWLRSHPFRRWLVPYVEVEVDAEGASYEDVRTSVDAVLAATVADVSVILKGSWDGIEPDRREPLKDPELDKVLIRGHYAHEPLVRLGGTPGLAPFVLRLPAGWAPGEDALAGLLDMMVKRDLGLVSIVLAEGPEGVTAARLERTAAFARARIVAEPGEDLDGAVSDVFGSTRVDGAEYDFLPTGSAPPAQGRRIAYQAKGDPSSRAEVKRLTGEVERLTAKVAELREESKSWRSNAMQYRRDIATLRKQVNELKGGGIRRIGRRLGLRRIKLMLDSRRKS